MRNPTDQSAAGEGGARSDGSLIGSSALGSNESWVWDACKADMQPGVNDGSNEEIRELPLTFSGTGEVKGYSFTQVRATDDGYIYRVEGCPCPVEGRGRPPITGHKSRGHALALGKCLPSRDVHYEVFRRMVNPMWGCVSYPRGKSFGVWAWTGENLEHANLLFNHILKS